MRFLNSDNAIKILGGGVFIFQSDGRRNQMIKVQINSEKYGKYIAEIQEHTLDNEQVFTGYEWVKTEDILVIGDVQRKNNPQNSAVNSYSEACGIWD